MTDPIFSCNLKPVRGTVPFYHGLLARADGSLAGFSKGVFRPEHEIPGELNKLFLNLSWYVWNDLRRLSWNAK